MRLANFCRIFLVAGALAAFSSWSLAVRDRQKVSAPGPDDKDVAGIPLIALDQARALWEEPTTLFLDVRSPGDYEVGHIAGALNMPDEEFAQRFPDLRSRFERARAIVVYCQSKDCGK